jgi:hypothetical protein
MALTGVYDIDFDIIADYLPLNQLPYIHDGAFWDNIYVVYGDLASASYFKWYIVNHSTINVTVFIECCMNGYLKIAEHMLDMCRSNIDQDDVLIKGLYFGCYHGKINMVEWIWSKMGAGGRAILWEKRQYVFDSICYHGPLQILKWWSDTCDEYCMNMDPPSSEICFYLDNGFRICCAQGHLEIAEWYCSKHEDFQIIKEGSIITPVIHNI